MPVSLTTPVTLGTQYSNAGTLGPFQEIDELVFQNTGGPLIFQFGSIDPTGAVHFDQQEVIYPPGTWAFRNLQGIRFRSNPGSTAATLQAVAAFFKEDPEPFSPGVVPGSVALTSTLNFQHNDIFVATEPTVDFEDQSNNDITWLVVDDNANSRVKVTPVFIGGAKYADKTTATAQIFTGNVVAGGASVAVGSPVGSLIRTDGVIFSSVATTAGTIFASTIPGDAGGFRFLINGAGNIQWGDGTGGADVNLQRLAAGLIGTNGSFTTGPVLGGFTGTQTAGTLLNSGASPIRVFATTATTIMFTIGITTDTQPRFEFDANGSMSWGAGGAAAVDTTWGRLGASIVGTTSSNISSGPLNNGRSTVGFYCENSTGRILNTGSVVTTSMFATAVLADTDWRWSLDSNGTQTFGIGTSVRDTTFGRLAAGELGVGTSTQNGIFRITASASNAFQFKIMVTTDTQPRFAVLGSGQIDWGPGGATAVDTSLSRVSAGGLLNNGNMYGGIGSTTLGATGNFPVDGTTLFNTCIIQALGAITVTVVNPTNPPTTTSSGTIWVKFRNQTGLGVTLTWGTAYTFNNIPKPPNIASVAGTIVILEFVWDPDASLWRCVGQF